MSKAYDVIVVGTGTMGAAACWHLARAGHRVLGLDRFEVPHGFGSHHGHSRMIRLSYFEHPDYVPLLRRAYALWEELEELSGRTLLVRTGGLYMGASDGAIVSGCLKASKAHDLPYELMNRKAVSDRYPAFALESDFVGFHESTAGVLLVDPVMTTLIEQTQKNGGEIHGNEPVIDWADTGSSVTVRTETSEYTAARMILAGGAWSEALLRRLNVPLRVTRQTMFWLRSAKAEGSSAYCLPAWFVETRDGRGIYGFPPLPGQDGFKVAEHVPGTEVTPDNVDRECTLRDWEALRPTVERYVPGICGDLVSMSCCLYTNSPDGNFILDQHPESERVHFAAGFSGHGFKFAPVIGEALAQMAMDGESTHPVGFLGLRRLLS